jgi:trans-AT polyketide synthase, acyltransferase and oxidoreductase domains
LLNALLKEGAITAEHATLAREVPMSHDLCVEADCGGHTDGGIPTILLPPILELRERLVGHFHYREPICMGLAGGIGMPVSAAAAFAMGADFIVTGSINQCTVESGASDTVKTMLQEAGIHDMAFAPAGDRFESGSRIQVLKKGVLFPMRANKLYSLYTQYGGLEEIPEAERNKLERNFFKRGMANIWQERLALLKSQGQEREVALAQANPKVRMAQIFRWYFEYSNQLALSGSKDDVVNYQIHTGPALGAFNQWVKGTRLEPWTQRRVDEIGVALMDAAAEHLWNLDRPSLEGHSSPRPKEN